MLLPHLGIKVATVSTHYPFYWDRGRLTTQRGRLCKGKTLEKKKKKKINAT